MTDDKKMPDFDQLTDRIIAESSTSPSLGIKTNLDTEDITKDNPYISNEKKTSKDEIEKYEKYFKE